MSIYLYVKIVYIDIGGDIMAKVIIEFDEEKDSAQDISAAVNKHKLLYAVNEIRDLYSQIINGKIYDPDVEVYVLSNGKVATEDDYKEAREKGELLSGGKYYLDEKWVENRLDDILEDVREFLY